MLTSRWMQRDDNSSRVSPLRLRMDRSLAPRKCPLRKSVGMAVLVIGTARPPRCEKRRLCEINSVKFLSSNSMRFAPMLGR